MGNKEKGANAERELLHKLVEDGYMAIRIAGSGLLPEPSCDLIAGKFKKKFAIECKSVKAGKKYLDSNQIERFMIFASIFGLKPLIAIRFNRLGWYFINPKHIERSKTGGLVIDLELAQKKGKRFAQTF